MTVHRSASWSAKSCAVASSPDRGARRIELGELVLEQPGDPLAVHCDGCPPGLTATVSYIADGPEFTPPVIYSVDSRQKLVYLVEATPVDGSSLKPSQIVDVDLPEPAP